MRQGVVSEVHANRVALEAVLADLAVEERRVEDDVDAGEAAAEEGAPVADGRAVAWER